MDDQLITYDPRLKLQVLGLFGKDVDEEGYVIQRNTHERVLAFNDESYVRLEDFAGLSKGSEIIIKSDIISLIDYAEKKRR